MTTVVISGANRGLGLEFVRQYAADGARVIAGARDPSAADALNALAQASGGKVVVHGLDVSSAASVDDFKAAVGDEPVDILIANAGVSGGDRQLGNLDYDVWAKTLLVNTLGPVRLAEAMLPNVRAGREKKLIAISSGLGSTAGNSGGFFVYRTSKAALNNAWTSLAVALKADGIICAPIHPGWVRTDMGGPQADLDPQESIAGMRKVIAGLTVADSGAFRGWNGKDMAW